MRTYTSPTKVSWESMKQRCANPNHISYPHYGGRGITYDPRWELFKNFLADMGERPPGTSLERVDNSEGYSVTNCMWATTQEQNNNKRTTLLITARGKTQTVRDWSTETGVPIGLIHKRHWSGWSGDECLNPDTYRRPKSKVGKLGDRLKARVGSANGCAILDSEQVLTIRRMRSESQYTYDELAAVFNVSRSTIAAIVTKRLWAHI